MPKSWVLLKKALYLHSAKNTAVDGWVAEWLGRGLQNLVRRFESAPNLRALYSLFAFCEGAVCFTDVSKVHFRKRL